MKGFFFSLEECTLLLESFFGLPFINNSKERSLFIFICYLVSNEELF